MNVLERGGFSCCHWISAFYRRYVHTWKHRGEGPRSAVFCKTAFVCGGFFGGDRGYSEDLSMSLQIWGAANKANKTETKRERERERDRDRDRVRDRVRDRDRDRDRGHSAEELYHSGRFVVLRNSVSQWIISILSKVMWGRRCLERSYWMGFIRKCWLKFMLMLVTQQIWSFTPMRIEGTAYFVWMISLVSWSSLVI